MQKKVNFGIYIANFSVFDSPLDFIDLAVEAEEHSWDGFFMWDHTVNQLNKPSSDPFTTLSAIAAKTSKIKIGTTVSGIPKYKPWLLARQIATIDHISNGRFILGVGLGSKEDYKPFHEDYDNRILKDKVEESLQILQGLFERKDFSFSGKHYQIDPVTFNPKPKQNPLPIWIGGMWTIKGPFRRASRFNGVFPLKVDEDWLSPNDYKAIISYINKFRDPKTHYDIIFPIVTPPSNDGVSRISEYIDVGVNWFVEIYYPGRCQKKEIFDRIRKGPPTV